MLGARVGDAGRVPRTVALAAFTLFLVVDFATANYGFFVPLTAVWCSLLLPGSRTCALWSRLLTRFQRPQRSQRSPHPTDRPRPLPSPPSGPPSRSTWRAFPCLASRSTTTGTGRCGSGGSPTPTTCFRPSPPAAMSPNSQTLPDGENWTAHAMVYKAGLRRPGTAIRGPAPAPGRLRLWFSV